MGGQWIRSVIRVDIGVVIYEAMAPQCGRSVLQVLVVRVDIEVVIYEAMILQCGRSVVQVLVVRVDIEVVIYEAMAPQCRKSVVQDMVVSGFQKFFYTVSSGNVCYVHYLFCEFRK